MRRQKLTRITIKGTTKHMSECNRIVTGSFPIVMAVFF